MKYLRRGGFAFLGLMFLWVILRWFALEVAYANLRGALIVEVSRVVDKRVILPEERTRLVGFYRDNLILLSCGMPFYMNLFIKSDMLGELRQGAEIAWKDVSSVEEGAFMCEGRLRQHLLDGD